MLMSYRVDDGIRQLCEQKILLNTINQICTISSASGISQVVNSLDFRYIMISLFKGSRLESRLVLQIKEKNEADILQKKRLIL